MSVKGMQCVDAEGVRILLPFDKVVKMQKDDESGPLHIKLMDPIGITIKITNKDEAARVWSAFQGWLMGFENP